MNTTTLLEKIRKSTSATLKKEEIPTSLEELGVMDTEDRWEVLGIKNPGGEFPYQSISKEELDKREARMDKKIKEHEL